MDTQTIYRTLRTLAGGSRSVGKTVCDELNKGTTYPFRKCKISNCNYSSGSRVLLDTTSGLDIPQLALLWELVDRHVVHQRAPDFLQSGDVPDCLLQFGGFILRCSVIHDHLAYK